MTSLLNPTSSSKIMTFCRTHLSEGTPLPGQQRKAEITGFSQSHIHSVGCAGALRAVLSPAASAAGATEAFLEIFDFNKFLCLAKSPSQG